MAKDQLNSDIVTIFLYAPKKRQLWSRWGTNLPNDITTGKTRPIRVPASASDRCRDPRQYLLRRKQSVGGYRGRVLQLVGHGEHPGRVQGWVL